MEAMSKSRYPTMIPVFLTENEFKRLCYILGVQTVRSIGNKLREAALGVLRGQGIGRKIAANDNRKGGEKHPGCLGTLL